MGGWIDWGGKVEEEALVIWLRWESGGKKRERTGKPQVVVESVAQLLYCFILSIIHLYSFNYHSLIMIH